MTVGYVGYGCNSRTLGKMSGGSLNHMSACSHAKDGQATLLHYWKTHSDIIHFLWDSSGDAYRQKKSKQSDHVSHTSSFFNGIGWFKTRAGWTCIEVWHSTKTHTTQTSVLYLTCPPTHRTRMKILPRYSHDADRLVRRPWSC